jgi:hypothetical protein
MVDKIGWTEPLESGRGVLEFVTKRVLRRVRCGAWADGLGRRMGIVAGVLGILGGRNNYDSFARLHSRRTYKRVSRQCHDTP